MHSEATNRSPVEEQEQGFCTVDHVSLQLNALEKFIARRFDEISMEINATAQQVDMAEDGIVRRFSEILEILSAISYSGSGESAANSGVELEAVISDTEQAANRIIDAADRIYSYLEDDKASLSGSDEKNTKEKIKGDIQEILMACTFQDLTGQRIRNTLNNLHQIETRLSSTFERLGIEVKPDQAAIDGQIRKVSSQSEIDALLAGMNGKASS